MDGGNNLAAQLAAQRKIAEENDAERRAQALKLPYVNLVSTAVPTEVDAMRLVPEEEAKKALIVPLERIGKKLTIAAFDPRLPEAKRILDELAKQFDVRIAIVSKLGLAHGWENYRY